MILHDFAFGIAAPHGAAQPYKRENIPLAPFAMPFCSVVLYRYRTFLLEFYPDF